MVDGVTAKILNRLKTIRGHVQGIERMVENDDYCIDVVNQILAVERACRTSRFHLKIVICFSVRSNMTLVDFR